MLNKRAATLLAFVLASSMALSTPAAAMAASGESEKVSQTEDEDSDETDEEEAEEDEDEDKDEKDSQDEEDEEEDSVKTKKADTKEDGKKDMKKIKGSQASSNTSKSASSTSSDKATTKTPEKQPRAGEAEDIDSQSDNGTVSGGTGSSSDNTTSGNQPGGSVSDNVISANTGDFKLYGDLSEGTDYSYEETAKQQQLLTIKTNKEVKISGSVSYGELRVESPEGANLTLDGLDMGENKPANIMDIKSSTGAVQIYLSEESTNTINTIRNASGKPLSIDGPGILKSSKIYGAAIIDGGNIQVANSWDTDPQNTSGKALGAAAIAGLDPNKEYKISGLKGYGDTIYSDGAGNIVMYLPKGTAALALNNIAFSGPVPGTLTRGATITPDPDGTLTPSPDPSATPDPGMLADPNDNGLYWINSGATYRSGATLQFYATGDGYGPEAPQDTSPERGATRYKPVSWTVAPNTSGSGTSDKGTWSKRSEVTTGQTVSGAYTSGEYRYKASFTPSTSLTTSVPYTLTVRYDRETYYGKNKKWKNDGHTDTKSVSFYIRNTSLTVTPTPTYTPRPTYYTTTTPVRTTITTTAAQSSVSSNARNASTGDHTPIGTLVFLMVAAAGSAVGIFRRKRDSF